MDTSQQREPRVAHFAEPARLLTPSTPPAVIARRAPSAFQVPLLARAALMATSRPPDRAPAPHASQARPQTSHTPPAFHVQSEPFQQIQVPPRVVPAQLDTSPQPPDSRPAARAPLANPPAEVTQSVRIAQRGITHRDQDLRTVFPALPERWQQARVSRHAPSARQANLSPSVGSRRAPIAMRASTVSQMLSRALTAQMDQSQHRDRGAVLIVPPESIPTPAIQPVRIALRGSTHPDLALQPACHALRDRLRVARGSRDAPGAQRANLSP